ncbi:MAG: beta-lactamase family protein [Verrucomicrobiae bacterium]|nr:beta-lactamase family protein [Verrucomicrobiae bacterium]
MHMAEVRSRGCRNSMRRKILCGALFLLAVASRPGAAPLSEAEAIRRFETKAQAEIDSGRLSGVSVAWIDDQRVVMTAAFGWADKTRRIPASPATVYRVGSISKLFTAVAAMQLAQAGELDIDAPARDYVPEFRIVDPFPDAAAPTLRQLMTHRAGLVRESPVGGYFDPTEPTAEATVASLADSVLVHPPGTVTKYSNSGITVVGRAVETLTQLPFDRYQAERILGPLRMDSSGFLLNRDLKGRLATGYLPVALVEGGFQERRAPHFEFGILPAGNLYSTVEDLGRFLACLFAEGRGPEGDLIRPETLREMWRVQAPGATRGFGLGFAMGQHQGRNTFGHMGAVYGFTSQLVGLPGERLGVVVLANDDLAIGPVRRLTRHSLDLLLATKFGPPPPAEPDATPMDPPSPADIAALSGEYESRSYWARIEYHAGAGWRATFSRQRFDLVRSGPDTFRAHGRLGDDLEVRFERAPEGPAERLHALGQTFRRIDPKALPEPPLAWRALVGSYGPAFIPLIVSIRNGNLYAMTENEYDYRLTPLNRTVFHMPPGMYESEQIVFQLDRTGRAHTAVLANMPLARRRR